MSFEIKRNSSPGHCSYSFRIAYPVKVNAVVVGIKYLAINFFVIFIWFMNINIPRYSLFGNSGD